MYCRAIQEAYKSMAMIGEGAFFVVGKVHEILMRTPVLHRMHRLLGFEILIHLVSEVVHARPLHSVSSSSS